MAKNNELHAFFAYFFCVVVYLVILATNETFLLSYQSNNEISFTEYDQIKYYKLLGYIFGSIFLLLSSRFVPLKVSAILGIFLYFLSMTATGLGNISAQTNFFYFSLYSASYMVVGYAIFLHLLCDVKLSNVFTIICVCFAVLVSFFINEIKDFIIISDRENALTELIITNVVLLGIFGLINFSYSIFGKEIKSDDYNFLGVVKNMELEIMCGFSLFYILMVVIDGYDVYSITDQLFTIVDSSTRDYMVLLIVFIVSLLMLYVKKVNIHLVNISSVGLLFTLFFTIPYWAEYETLGLMGWFVIGLLFSIVVISNVFVITKKFDEANLVTATSLYLLGACVGYYCGYITINTSEDTLGENGFLISVCFVLFSLLSYYIYFLKKYKL